MIVADAGDERALAPLYAGGWDAPREVREGVARDSRRRARTRRRGASSSYTRRFDDPAATRRDVAASRCRRARTRARLVPETIAAGLELARERIADYHARQKPAEIRYRTADLSEYAFLSRPLASRRRVRARRQRLAAVDRAHDGRAGEGRRRRPRSSVTTPPQRDGSINPAILYACSLCEVDELYAVGGAQADGRARVRHGDRWRASTRSSVRATFT